MPWCSDCEKYWAPSAMNDDGSCPRCGTDLDEPAIAAAHSTNDDADEKTPWHFKVMVVAIVGYLGWRFVEIGINIFT
jgi:uncharacterized membrane protein YvbJ